MRKGPQGPHTYRSRWERERRRSTQIAAIPLGSKLTKIYGNKIHEIICRDGYWEYDGKAFPTLYSLVVAIAGAHEYPRKDKKENRSMANYSSLRFFGLKKRRE